MNLASAAGFASPLLGAIARVEWQRALFIAAVWVLCRLARRLPAALRCALWWTASVKLLIGLAWPAPLGLPLLPATATSARPAATTVFSALSAGSAAPGHIVAAMLRAKPWPAPGRPSGWASRFTGLLAAAWGAGVLLQLGWLGR